jgi:hypothetical protein
MSWVTEGISKYPKTGEKWLKKSNFRARRVQFKTPWRSHGMLILT